VSARRRAHRRDGRLIRLGDSLPGLLMQLASEWRIGGEPRAADRLEELARKLERRQAREIRRAA